MLDGASPQRHDDGAGFLLPGVVRNLLSIGLVLMSIIEWRAEQR